MATEPLVLTSSTGDRQVDEFIKLMADELSQVRAERQRAADDQTAIDETRQLTNTLGVDLEKGTVLGFDSSGNLAKADSSAEVDGFMVADSLVGANEVFIPVIGGQIVEVLVESAAEVTIGALAYTTKTTAQAGKATSTAPTTVDDIQQILGRWVDTTDPDTGRARMAFLPQMFVVQV